MVTSYTDKYSPGNDPLALAVPTSQVSAGNMIQTDLSERACTAKGTQPAFQQADPTVIATPTPGQSNGVQDEPTFHNVMGTPEHTPPPPNKATPMWEPPAFAEDLPDQTSGPHWGVAKEARHP